MSKHIKIFKTMHIIIADIRIEVGVKLPAHGWQEHPEIIDSCLQKVGRTIFTVNRLNSKFYQMENKDNYDADISKFCRK